VRAALKARGVELAGILLTHYDSDHTGGVTALRKATGCPVVGPEPAPWPIDSAVGGGAVFELSGFRCEAIDTPGHARPHRAYYLPDQGWLFSGDCLFGAGCGRVRNDDFEAMFASLMRLAALPPVTRVYFGHEYTLANLAFAASIEPENPEIPVRRARVAADRADGRPSPGNTLAVELATNPFLRAADAVAFARRRRAKDTFQG
jgi:hydroxyacylglutathione hydrolase